MWEGWLHGFSDVLLSWGFLAVGAIGAAYLIYDSWFRKQSSPSDTSTSSILDNAEVPRSELEWNFEISGPFVGLSAGSKQEIRVHDFQAHGWNRTGDPITNACGYVRSDRTNKKYPLFFNIGGVMVSSEDIDPIPINAHIDTFTPFLPDRTPISMNEFLTQIVPFTFFFEYDGKQIRRSFSIEQIEPRIQKYEQQIRKSALNVSPQKMTRREKAVPTEISLTDLARLSKKKYGWNFDGSNSHIMDMRDGLREAGARRHIQFTGRKHRKGSRSVIMGEPRLPICGDHFESHRILWDPFLHNDDNEQTFTYSVDVPHNEMRANGFVDLHVDQRAAIEWLKNQGDSFKGKRGAAD